MHDVCFFAFASRLDGEANARGPKPDRIRSSRIRSLYQYSQRITPARF